MRVRHSSTNSTFVLGLTGSIGMGKSAVAAMLKKRRIPVFEADRYARALLGPKGKAIGAVRYAFPEVIKGKTIDRDALGKHIFKNPSARKKLEKILHPLVRAAEETFIKSHRQKGTRLIVLDIPLLFETKAEKFCDAVLVVTAPAETQRARVLARPGMTAVKFNAIRKAQMPDRDKRRRADFILDTGGTLAETEKTLRTLIQSVLTGRHARNRP